MGARLREQYKSEIAPALMKEFGYKNVHQIPRVDKVIVNMGLGEAAQNPKILDRAVEELTVITGQKAVLCRAKKSVASFKLREGQAIGARVTLRGDRMYEFLDRLISLALPRVRDFRGVSSKAFDGRGNYNLGIREQLIFPEVDYDKMERSTGMNVTVCTTGKTDEEARSLLSHLGMPFRK